MIDKIKNLMFWKKFSRFLMLGLSLMVILYFFQVQPNILAQSTLQDACYNDTVTNLNPNGTILAAGTKSVTLTWNAAAHAPSSYYVSFRTTSDASLYDNYVNSTSVTVSNLQDGTSYKWAVRPFYGSACSGGLAQATVSVASAQPTAGQLTCNISQSQPIPQTNNSYLYTLSGGSPNAVSSWGWDLTNDGSIDSYGQTIQQNYFASSTARLHITDSSGRFGDCYTNINLPTSGTTGNIPICTITAYPSNNVSAGTNVSFTGNATAYNGKAINSYQWDFDNDGVYDTGVNNFNTANYTFNTPQTVRLHVIDSGGLGNDCTTYINIGNQYPAGSCSTEPFYCPGGGVVYRNPNSGCNFNQCPGSGTTFPSQPGQIPVGVIPSFQCPAGTSAQSLGSDQSTTVCVANINDNFNVNFNADINDNINSNFSNSWSSSYATGGGAGSANVTITW